MLRPFLELVGVRARSARELERPGVVVDEDLGVVGNAVLCDAFDPGGDGLMLPRPCRARNLSVSDVPDQHMPEAELILIDHRRRPHGPDELLLDELVESLPDSILVPLPDRSDRAGPENLAHDGSVVEERLSLGGKRVDAGGDQRLDGLGNGDRFARRGLDGPPSGREDAAVPEHADELLRVEGVATRTLEQGGLGLRRENGLHEQGREQPSRLLGGERRESDRRRVPVAAAPRGVALVELRARRADDEQRDPRRPVEGVLDELEQRRVRPMEVFQDEDERAARRERLEEPPPRGERLGPLRASSSVGPDSADERRQPGREPIPLGRLLHRRRDRRRQLLSGLVGAVGLENPGCSLTISPSAQKVIRSP